MTHSALVQLFVGDPIANATELACARRLSRDLDRAGTEAVLMSNLMLGPTRRQIDLIVATAATAVVVEIKGWVHPVHGGVNGPWSLMWHDGTRVELGRGNPYHQALESRFAVTDSLRGGSRADVKELVAGMLCLHPAPPRGSAIPSGDRKLTIGGYADLLALLKVPRAGALGLERWRSFAEEHGCRDQAANQPSEAERLVAEYLKTYEDLRRATLGPYVEPLFAEGESTQGLAALCADGGQIQIVGPSGSGKTELLKHLGVACAMRGSIPILIRGRDFDRDIGSLLRADTARYTRAKVPALLKAAADVGVEIVLHVDAINECPADRRANLIAALQAARINHSVRIVLTGQEETALPASLRGALVNLRQPDSAHARRLVEAHLGRPLEELETVALEVVATAQDAAVLATVLGKTNAVDGRFSLYDGFTRARLRAAAPQAGEGMANLATAMRNGFLAAMPRAAAERIADLPGASTIEAACTVGLLWSEGNRIGFRHDLIGDFFAAAAVLRRAATPAELDELARRPIHAELRELLLGGCATLQEIEALLSNAPDPRLLKSALSGRAGAKAKDYVISRLQDVIARLKRRYARLELALPDGVASARELSSLSLSLGDIDEADADDRIYLDLLPSALGDGLLPELLSLFHAVDQRLIAEADRLRGKHEGFRLAWLPAVFGSVYGMHHHGGPRHLQDLLQAIQNFWPPRDQKTIGLDVARLNLTLSASSPALLLVEEDNRLEA